MSYCRFSSDNWKSDIYCFADVSGGYTIYVAGRRHKGDIPQVPESLLDTDHKKWLRLHKKQMKFLDTVEFEDIDLKYAGESFNEPNLCALLVRLIELQELGYHVPDSAIDILIEEIEKG